MLIILGFVAVVAGILLYFHGSIPFLGRLPGDIRIERPGYSIYFPIATGIVISIVISLILYAIRIFRQ